MLNKFGTYNPREVLTRKLDTPARRHGSKMHYILKQNFLLRVYVYSHKTTVEQLHIKEIF